MNSLIKERGKREENMKEDNLTMISSKIRLMKEQGNIKEVNRLQKQLKRMKENEVNLNGI